MAKPRKKASRRAKRTVSEQANQTQVALKGGEDEKKHCDSTHCPDVNCPNYSVYVDPLFRLPAHSLYLRRLGGGEVDIKAVWNGLSFGGLTHIPVIAHLIFDDLAFVQLSAEAYVLALEFYAITANGDQMYEVLPPQFHGRDVLGWLDEIAELEEPSEVEEDSEDPVVSSTFTSGLRQSDMTRAIDYRSFAFGMSPERTRSMLRVLTAS